MNATKNAERPLGFSSTPEVCTSHALWSTAALARSIRDHSRTDNPRLKAHRQPLALGATGAKQLDSDMGTSIGSGSTVGKRGAFRSVRGPWRGQRSRASPGQEPEPDRSASSGTTPSPSASAQSSLKALISNPLATAVAGSTATGFVAWLRETGGRSNELRNLSESIASLKNDIARQQDRQQADLRAIQDRQQAELRAIQDRQQTTNDNLYNLQVISVGTAATATVIAVFRGRG